MVQHCRAIGSHVEMSVGMTVETGGGGRYWFEWLTPRTLLRAPDARHRI
jgi:hypothetical protein